MADADWFVIVKEEIRGPFTADQMRSAAKKGLVNASTSVRKGASGDWYRAEQVKGLLKSAPQAPPSLDSVPDRTSVPPTPIEPARTPPVSNPTLPPEAPPIVNVGLVTPVDPATSRSRSPVRRQRRRASPIPVLIAGVAGIGILLGMLYWLSRDPPATKPGSESDESQTTGQPAQSPSPAK